MHHIKLKIEVQTKTDTFFELIDNYLDALYRCRQIINEEKQYESTANGVSVNLYCPEIYSYKEENTSEYGRIFKNELEGQGCTLDFVYQGIDLELGLTDISENPQSLLLGTNIISPLRDSETLDFVPLYQIPYTYHDKKSYDDINSWFNNYERILGLWFNGSVGELWLKNQLQNHDSDLNKQGITCCKRIEEVTGIATYYSLFNYRTWGTKKDLARKCPNCNDEWILDNKEANDLYNFKCNNCRLVSQLSLNT